MSAPTPPTTRPAARAPMDRLAVLIATSAGIGYAPVSPGTFGSLPGVAVGASLALLRLSVGGAAGLLLVTFLLLAMTAVAWWAIARVEALWQVHDDKRIVADEVVGQAIALAFAAPTLPTLVVGFGLFRLLDIAKPSLIGRIDREAPGAVGTLFDDVLAGAVAGAVMCLLPYVF